MNEHVMSLGTLIQATQCEGAPSPCGRARSRLWVTRMDKYLQLHKHLDPALPEAALWINQYLSHLSLFLV